MTNSETTGAPAQAETDNTAMKAKRRKGLTILGAVVAGGVLGYGAYWLLVGSHHVSTDDAYVNADLAQVTPLVSGSVARVLVSDTQNVKVGQPLVVIDDADARLALERAQAQLSQAQRKVQGYFASDKALAAQVASRGASQQRAASQVATAQADLDNARLQYSRRQALQGSGAVSGEELTQAQTALKAAQSALVAARAGQAEAQAQTAVAAGQRSVNAALISGGAVDANPEVAAARAAVDQAQLDLNRTIIAAPVAGVIARRAVQVGQRVAIGAPLMTIAPVQAAYVDANFKETQLKRVAVGQRVILTADIYGGRKYHGTVAGIGAGTGSAFSLIPSQNASGNWIKIVQRLPVRVVLDPKELRQFPLRVGMSMKVDIDISGHG